MIFTFRSKRRPSLLPLLGGDIPSSTSTYMKKILQTLSQIVCRILFLPAAVTVKTIRTAAAGVTVGYVTLVEHPLLSLLSLVVFVQLMLLVWSRVSTLSIHAVTLGLGHSWTSKFPPVMHTPIPIPPTREPKLHFLVPTHNSNRDLCGCLRSHLINGFEPILVNFGHDAGGDRENKYYKLIGVHKFLHNAQANDLQPKDVVAIVDGFDLWSQLPATLLMERFRASGKRIILGLDKQCFPNDPKGPVCNDIPESPLPTDIYGSMTDKDPLYGPREHTRPRWVNSGSVIGYFEDILRLYDSMIDYRGADNDEKSDQRIFAVHYYWGNFSLSLDFESQIVISAAFSVNELDTLTNVGDLTIRGIGPWTEATMRGDVEIPRIPVIRYTTLNTVPIFLHFPGIAKRIMNTWHNRMWWTVETEDRLKIVNEFVMDKEVKVVENGEKLKFRELCAQYMINFSFSGRGGYGRNLRLHSTSV